MATPPLCVDPNDLRYIAFHEAGHAVACVVLSLPLTTVDLKKRTWPDGRISVGQTRSDGLEFADLAGKGEEAAMPLMIQRMAGPLAEHRVNPDDIGSTSNAGDWDDAANAANVAICQFTWTEDCVYIAPDEQSRNLTRLQALGDKALRASYRLVEDHWPAITKVAELLLEKTMLGGDQVTAIVNDLHSSRSSRG